MNIPQILLKKASSNRVKKETLAMLKTFCQKEWRI